MAKELISTYEDVDVFYDDDGGYEIVPKECSWATITINYTGGGAEELAKDIARLLSTQSSRLVQTN